MAKQKKQTALITGASAGIGEATALLLVENGYDLILVARREERLKKIAAQIKKSGAQAHILICDVQKKDQVMKVAKEESALLKKVDVLVNNAGLALGIDPMTSASVEDWDAMIDTNIKGLLYWTRVLVPYMAQKKSGHIVNLGSVAGRWVYPGGGVYCATKYAVRALSEGLRMDLKGTNVRVSNIEPGMVETEFSMVRLKDADRAKAVYQGLTPLSPQDIAESILWCLKRPQHVNIQELVIFPTDQVSISLVHRK